MITAQDRAHAGEQLARAERLGDVVVGRELEPHHAVGLVIPAAHDDDRDLGRLAQLFRKLHSVFASQSQIEDDHVDRLLGEHLLHVRSGRDRGDAQVVFAEVLGDQLPHGRVVIDRQHMGR